jgi:ribosomal protein L11 methylase PrmA
MGIFGGTLGYRLLKLISKDGETGYMDGSAFVNKSKLESLLGPGFWEEIKNKTIIDFGCGLGAEAVEMAEHGAHRVIGVDNQEKWLNARVSTPNVPV